MQELVERFGLGAHLDALTEQVALHQSRPRGLLHVHTRVAIGRDYLGPLLPGSALAIGPDGDVAGAVLVNDSDGGPPFGGPWLSQIFRHPDAPGLGTALLRRALAAGTRDGVPAIGLAVTHANPARARYAALGFAEVIESLSVDV